MVVSSSCSSPYRHEPAGCSLAEKVVDVLGTVIVEVKVAGGNNLLPDCAICSWRLQTQHETVGSKTVKSMVFTSCSPECGENAESCSPQCVDILTGKSSPECGGDLESCSSKFTKDEGSYSPDFGGGEDEGSYSPEFGGGEDVSF